MALSADALELGYQEHPTGAQKNYVTANHNTETTTDLIIALQDAVEALGGGPSGVEGTGFIHVTSGVQDGTAKLVKDEDVAADAEIAQSKIAGLVTALASKMVGSNNLSELTNTTTARNNIGLGAVNNTPDSLKPVSGPQQTALDFKADLVGGTVPSSQLPAYVDAIDEAANFAALPATGIDSRIYITTDDNKTYRWSGSAYVEISSSLALGETSATAYRGDRGKTAYDHSQLVTGNPHNVTKGEVGLGNVLDAAQEVAANKDASNGYVGLSLFKIKFSNALNTFTSFLTNSNTAARTYTFRDRDGIIADDTDLAGKADLVGGVVPSSQLPAYVDDVEEYANFGALPGTGASSKIYVTLDTNKTYRWSGSSYVELGDGGVVLGTTSSTAHRGDHGSAAYTHSQLTSGNPHNVTKSDVGLGSVTNTQQQPINTDLTAISGLSPSNDDVLQCKAGSWVNRTLAQLKSDLALIIGTNVQAWSAALDEWAAKARPTGTVVGTSDSQVLTTKTLIATSNVVEEITTLTDSATPTPTGGSLRNLFTVTALASNATVAAPSGTPQNGNYLTIRIKDAGVAKTLAWNAIYRVIGVTLPTTTTASKTLYVGARYNSADSKWDVLAVSQEV